MLREHFNYTKFLEAAKPSIFPLRLTVLLWMEKLKHAHGHRTVGCSRILSLEWGKIT